MKQTPKTNDMYKETLIHEEQASNGVVFGMIKVEFSNSTQYHVYKHEGRLGQYDGGSLPLNFKMTSIIRSNWDASRVLNESVQAGKLIY